MLDGFECILHVSSHYMETELNKIANASQNKKSCNPALKPTRIVAHFILPNRTQAHHPKVKMNFKLSSID